MLHGCWFAGWVNKAAEDRPMEELAAARAMHDGQDGALLAGALLAG